MIAKPTGSNTATTLGKRGPALLDPGDRAFWAGLVIVVLSLISATATYLILTGLTPIVPLGNVVVPTLFVNVVLIVAMFAAIAWQGVGLANAWRDKIPGARLHVRIVVLFSVIAALPAILLALAATTTFSRSLDGWFSTKTRQIISANVDVARAYLDVHGQLINTDILNMARDVGDAGTMDAQALHNLLLAQVALRGLQVGYIIDADGKVVASALDDDKVPYQKPPLDAFVKANEGQVPLLDSNSTARVYALTKLSQMPGKYLYVGRAVSPAVLSQIRRTQQNTDEYERLRQSGKNLKIAHGLMYFMISLTSLLAAIWVGLWFAARFVAPIRRLIEAAQEVSKGNLAVALPEKRGEGDLRRLSMTFNKMTVDLKNQHDTLVAVNEQLNERRSFMEAVLSGVSAGVIGLDSEGKITLVSRSAEKLIGQPAADLTGHKLSEAIAEFEPVLENCASGVKQKTPDQIALMVGTNERTFAVQVTQERSAGGNVGSVVTFDDVTDLVVAQRTSAWADVARRIAHEIKNPLTPIQLSAERIKRKYGSQITTDKDIFDKLTDTISRQVGDIKGMVDEFASFARMPQPQMEQGDLREAVHEPVVLFRESHPAITFDLDMPSKSVAALVDRRLLGQAFTNLVKNGTEAIDAMTNSPDKPEGYRGRIEVRLIRNYDNAVIEVIDNGVGLPKQNRAKLLEPYVTTRAKGTGLGLAIVQKIIEQHRGTLALEDAPPAPDRPRGAMMRVTLPMPPMEEYRLPAIAETRQGAQPSDAPPSTDAAVHSPPAPKADDAASPSASSETAVESGQQREDAPASSNRQPAPTGETAVQEAVPQEPDFPPTPTVDLSQPQAQVPAAAANPAKVRAPSVSPVLLKNSDRVMPRPSSETVVRPQGRTQGVR